MMESKLLKIVLIGGGAVLLYNIFRNREDIPMNKPLPQDKPSPAPEDNFSNFTGIFKKKTKKTSGTSRQVATRCETNLERLGRLYPDIDNYNAELGKAFQQHGSNFNTWAQTTAKPCFVVGMQQGGLQSGSVSFDARDLINNNQFF